MSILAFSLAVVGADYPNKDGGNRRTEIAFCDRGESVELRPEPKNEHDEHAIAVFSARGFQIGYLPSQRAVYVGGLLRDGHTLTALFQEVTQWGAAIRIGVDEVPTLPQQRERFEIDSGADPESGFWPDETPAEDW